MDTASRYQLHRPKNGHIADRAAPLEIHADIYMAHNMLGQLFMDSTTRVETALVIIVMRRCYHATSENNQRFCVRGTVLE
jgi:hypothetical protein